MLGQAWACPSISENMLQKITRTGWLAVEVALLLVALCTLLHLILGASGGSFISSVAANTIDFLQKVPSGTVLGLLLIAVLYLLIKPRVQS